MAYRNILGPLGHEWIGEYDVQSILKRLPESHYRAVVRFSDNQDDLLLKDCTRKERNIESIIIYFLDGTYRLDPDPFVYHVYGRVSSYDVLWGTGEAILYFAYRFKRPYCKYTKNEDLADIKSMRELVREKLVKFTYMEDLEYDPENRKKDCDLIIPINGFCRFERLRIFRLLETVDHDEVRVKIEFDISRATIDQLQRIDNDMEMILASEDVDATLEIEDDEDWSNL